MSSANEQLAPPPKPRISPLDFRNTDLVSRLLAATPPYLYNMSLLPNTYFFSEMLRSFVQAKADSSNRSSPGSFQTRRTRKRPWNSPKNESFHKADNSPKPEHTTNDWSIKNSYPEHKISDCPLELTTGKITVLDNDDDHKGITTKENTFNNNLIDRKIEIPLHDQVDSLYSSVNQETNTSGLILPPPPPMWYPPLYPTTPYGIDPLHFFIDLRVSGHIYDRKNQREAISGETSMTTTKSTESEDANRQKQIPVKETFKQSRHTSAFSVPTPHASRNAPMNLSHNEDFSEFNSHESKNIKFDVKSMGFEKKYNKTGINYIMNNLNNIFKTISELSQEIKSEKSPESAIPNENDNETEEQRQKRVKDLRALIGLELVVDYVNHAKPQARRVPEENNLTDTESIGSPTLEVVAVHDET